MKEYSEAVILIAHGTCDSDAPYSVMEEFAKHFAHPLSEFISVPGGEHMELHSILSEEAYNEQICVWLEQVTQCPHGNVSTL